MNPHQKGPAGSTELVSPLSERPVRWSHRLEMAGLSVVAGLTRTLSPVHFTRVVRALGWPAASVFRVRRAVVDRNLALAFPDEPAHRRGEIAVEAYRHLASQSALLLRLLDDDATRRAVLDGVTVADPPTESALAGVAQRHQAGSGTLILTGHLGNWEVAAGSMPNRGVPVHAIATRQTNPMFDARVRRMRGALGVSIIERDDAPREVPRLLSSGATVLLAADQFTWKGLPVQFFGHPTLAARGPATFARRADVETVLVAALADTDDPTRHRLVARSLGRPGGAGRVGAQRFLQRYMSGLEGLIRDHPDQYLWHHRRWRPLEGRVPERDLELLSPDPPGSNPESA